MTSPGPYDRDPAVATLLTVIRTSTTTTPNNDNTNDRATNCSSVRVKTFLIHLCFIQHSVWTMNFQQFLFVWSCFTCVASTRAFLMRQNSCTSARIQTIGNPAGWSLREARSDSEVSQSEEAERLKEQAQKLREEIEQFQSEKDSMEEAERRQVQAELDEKQAFIDRYSAVVPILKPDGSTVEEKVQFPPKLSSKDDENPSSNILVFEAPLPLGILLGEHESIPGMTAVDEVAEGSNGESAGVQEGDLLRACTACKVEMDQPMWQLMAGGIGRPKTVRYMFSTDLKPFEQVMESLGSNRMDPEERSVLLVVERKS